MIAFFVGISFFLAFWEVNLLESLVAEESHLGFLGVAVLPDFCRTIIAHADDVVELRIDGDTLHKFVVFI